MLVKKKRKWIQKLIVVFSVCMALLLGQEQMYALQMESADIEVEIPVFMLLIEGEEGSFVTNAFYVQDTYGTGNTYLLTSVYAGVYAESGYTLTLVAKNCWEEVSVAEVDTESGLTYLKVENEETIEEIYPFPSEQNMEESNGILTYMTMEDEELVTDAGYVDISGYSKSDGIYYTGISIETSSELLLLGAPYVHGESAGVMGMFSMSTEGELILYDLTHLDFMEEMAIVTDETSQQQENETEHESENETQETESQETESQEKDPVGDVENNPLEGQDDQPSDNQQDENEPVTDTEGSSQTRNDYGWLIVIVIVIAIAAYYTKSNQKKKKVEGQGTSDTAEAVQSVYEEGTILLSDEEQDHLQQQIEQAQMLQQEPSLARWQIRGVSGAFAGQVFALNDRLEFGRNEYNDIVFPQGTKGISNKHCYVQADADLNRVVIRDENSSYGTYLGRGIRLEPSVEYQLNEGDVFYLAVQEQSFRLEPIGFQKKELTPIVKAVSLPCAGENYFADVNGRILFGKGQRAQVAFDASETVISTNHCVLYHDNTGLYLMDLGSTNGTFLAEGQRLRPNTPYCVSAGMSFFLVSPKYTFVITKE